jgi:uncharacterized protein YdaU (DUF1376 family)
MAKKHYQPFFWGDYLKDTGQLTLTEHGAYLRLIGEYWNTGIPITDDKKRIYRAVGAVTAEEQEAINLVLEKYFTLQDGAWKHKRIEADLIEHAIQVQRAADKAKAAADARWNASSNASSIKSECIEQCSSNANHSTPLQPISQYNKTPNSQGGVGVLINQNQGGFRVMPILSDAALAAARKAADGWDIYRLAAVYEANINERGREKPKDINKAFPAWCRAYTKERPPA